MNKILTIIIPAYNVGKYIGQGLDSLTEDENLLEDIEILVVNDGSKDNTLEIVGKYVERFPQAVRVVSQENMGHGGALNTGFAESEGLFLRVLDGDDWVNNEGLRRQVGYVKKHLNELSSVDAILNPSETVYVQEGGRKEVRRRLPVKSGSQISLDDINKGKYYWDITGVTYRSSIYKDKVNVSLDKKVSYDDMEYVLYPIPYINKVLYLDDVIVQYRYGTESQSMTLSNRQKNLWMQEKVLNSCIEYYRKHNNEINGSQKKSMYLFLAFQISVTSNICFSMPDYRDGKKRAERLLIDYPEFSIDDINNKKLKMMSITKFKGYNLVSSFYRKFKLGV